MGIGNTSPVFAIVAVFSGLPVSQVTGVAPVWMMPGWREKIAIIEQSIVLNNPIQKTLLDVLRQGGWV